MGLFYIGWNHTSELVQAANPIFIKRPAGVGAGDPDNSNSITEDINPLERSPVRGAISPDRDDDDISDLIADELLRPVNPLDRRSSFSMLSTNRSPPLTPAIPAENTSNHSPPKVMFKLVERQESMDSDDSISELKSDLSESEDFFEDAQLQPD